MTTYLYAIGHKSGPVKIGISDNPQGRLAMFQTSCPFRIQLLHAEPCESREIAYAEERFAHRFLRENRLHGEWFDICGNDGIECVRSTVWIGAAWRKREADGEFA